MTDTPIHDWLQPRLQALVAEAATLGFAQDVVIAVMADIATGPGFNRAPPPGEPAPPAVPAAAVPETLPPDYSAPSLGNVGDWFRPETNF